MCLTLVTKGNWSLKISYLGFGYQNELVSKLVSNQLVNNYTFLFIIVTILVTNNF